MLPRCLHELSRGGFYGCVHALPRWFHRTSVHLHGVSWCLHETSWASSVRSWWCKRFHGAFRQRLWCYHGVFMVLPWRFHGFPLLVLPMCLAGLPCGGFHGAFMVVCATSWQVIGGSMVLPWRRTCTCVVVLLTPMVFPSKHIYIHDFMVFTWFVHGAFEVECHDIPQQVLTIFCNQHQCARSRKRAPNIPKHFQDQMNSRDG